MSPEGERRGQGEAGEPVKRKRRTGLSRSARFAAIGVAAVVLGGAAVGLQVWDRSRWVAARYPAESVESVTAGETVVRSGLRWAVQVEPAPPSGGDKPGRVMLRVTVLVTPVNEEAIKDFLPPTVEFRDRNGREWMTITAGGMPIRDDMQVGRTERITAYGVVPEDLADTVQVALVYSAEDRSEVLLFNR